MKMVTSSLSPLQQTAAFPLTDYWNDSCSIEELQYAIANGAVGATSNPTIVLAVLKKELPLWRDRIHQIIAENPEADEVEIAWQVIEEMGVKAANLLISSGKMAAKAAYRCKLIRRFIEMRGQSSSKRCGLIRLLRTSR